MLKSKLELSYLKLHTTKSFYVEFKTNKSNHYRGPVATNFLTKS